MDISGRIKQLRQENGYQQKEIAELLNISNSAYSNYEGGKREIDLQSLVKLADFYDVKTDYILCRTDKKQNDINSTIDSICCILGHYKEIIKKILSLGDIDKKNIEQFTVDELKNILNIIKEIKKLISHDISKTL